MEAAQPDGHDSPAVRMPAARAALDGRVLDSIRQANLSFLALAVARAAVADGRAVFGLAAPLAARIARLDAAGCSSAASCPYTLFNLGFEDARFWRSVVVDAHAPTVGSIADDATLARTAVFLGWHLAQSNELTAALVLGMTPAVREAWRGLPLSALDRAAMAALPRLEARWGTHARFWPKLLDAASEPSAERIEAVRLLGLQLLAAGGMPAPPAHRP
jgi:hypothetical protein